MRKKRIIISVAVILAICISVVTGFLLNEVFGNPVSKYLVKRSVSEYLEENYSDSDFVIEKVGYDFKNMEYYARITSLTNQDEFFYITTDSTGQNIDDNYDLYYDENGVYFDDYEAAENVTEFNTGKNTFSITKDTSECDNVFFVEDDCFSEPSDTMIEDDFGITFTDSSDGTSETIAIVKIKYCGEIHGENAISAEIVGRNGNSLLIEVYVGVLHTYSFLYKANTNEFIKLSPDGEWYIHENTIIGKTLALSVDEEVDLYAYNWEGELLYSKENILSSTGVSDNWLYFIEMSEGEADACFTVYKMRIDGTEQTEHYSVTLSKFSYIAIVDNSKILLYDYDTEEETEIDLFTLEKTT